MSIPITNLQKDRIVDQISRNLIGLQTDVRNNAIAHKAMANAQSPDLATLQSFVTDCIAEYQRRLKWCSDLRADPVRKQRLVDALTDRGWVEADVTDIFDALSVIITALSVTSRKSYLEISVACDATIASTNPPDSLWPE